MNHKKALAVLFAAVCSAAALSGCTSERSGDTADIDEVSATTEASADETEPDAETTAPETTVTEAVTEAEAETDSDSENDETTTTAADEKPAKQADGNTRILWSERGLEAIGVLGVGYGQDLKVGEEYLGWKMTAFNGIVDDDGNTCSEMNVDFTYNGTLSVNGIATVLPADDPDNPNALYLRVDNQAEFPYFPQDKRPRGWFIVETSRDVFRMLELDDPPVASKYEVAVSMTVTDLHIHMKEGGFDTIRVTAASKR